MKNLYKLGIGLGIIFSLNYYGCKEKIETKQKEEPLIEMLEQNKKYLLEGIDIMIKNLEESKLDSVKLDSLKREYNKIKKNDKTK